MGLKQSKVKPDFKMINNSRKTTANRERFLSPMFLLQRILTISTKNIVKVQ